jgi:hypothetical protein
VTNVAGAARGLARSEVEDTGSSPVIPAAPEEHDGTPIEGVLAALSGPVVEGSFVAGEIDVPTPRPELVSRDAPAVEFTAASAILGPTENPVELDPDTGKRTPPLERR